MKEVLLEIPILRMCRANHMQLNLSLAESGEVSIKEKPVWCKTVLDDKRRKTPIVDHWQDGNRCQD